MRATLALTVALLYLVAPPPVAAFLRWGAAPANTATDVSTGDSSAAAKPAPIVGNGVTGQAPANLEVVREQLMQTYTDKASFSACFKAAVAELQSTCRAELVDEETRGRLAVRFVTCQLSVDGMPERAPDCPSSYLIKNCVRRLADEKLYDVYVQFRLHVDHLCFHIQQDLFHARTEHAVRNLQRASSAATQKMADLALGSQALTSTLHEMQQQQIAAAAAAEEVTQRLDEMSVHEEKLQRALSDKVRYVAALSETADAILAKQRDLELRQVAAASAADERARLQATRLANISRSAAAIEGSVGETHTAAVAIEAMQRDTTNAVSQMLNGMRQLGKAHSDATRKAEAMAKFIDEWSGKADAMLASQLEDMKRLSAQVVTASEASERQQRSIVATSGDIIESMEQLRDGLRYVSDAVGSIEMAAFHASFVIAVVFFTTAEPLRAGRFAALLVGPVACFVVESCYMADFGRALTAIGVGTPPGTTEYALVRAAHASVLRRACTAAVVAALGRAWWLYEQPDVRQRRLLRAVVDEALADANVVRERRAVAASPKAAADGDDKDEVMDVADAPPETGSRGRASARGRGKMLRSHSAV